MTRGAFRVETRDGATHGFDDIVAAKRFLDRSTDGVRCVRARDGEVLAARARVSDGEMQHLAKLFRRHD